MVMSYLHHCSRQAFFAIKVINFAFVIIYNYFENWTIVTLAALFDTALFKVTIDSHLECFSSDYSG